MLCGCVDVRVSGLRPQGLVFVGLFVCLFFSLVDQVNLRQERSQKLSAHYT